MYRTIKSVKRGGKGLRRRRGRSGRSWCRTASGGSSGGPAWRTAASASPSSTSGCASSTWYSSGSATCLAGEPDQPEPEQVVEVGRHLVDVPAAGAGADHVEPGGDQAGAHHADRPTGAHVDRGLRAAAQQVHQDPRLVGREVVEDPDVRRVRLLVAPHVAGPLEQLLAALAQRGLPGRRSRPRRAPASRRRARPRRRAAPVDSGHALGHCPGTSETARVATARSSATSWTSSSAAFRSVTARARQRPERT